MIENNPIEILGDILREMRKLNAHFEDLIIESPVITAREAKKILGCSYSTLSRLKNEYPTLSVSNGKYYKKGILALKNMRQLN